MLDGVIVDHSLEGNEKTRKKLMQEAKQLWQKEYPNDPFEVELNPESVIAKYRDGRTDFSYDILAAAGRQKEFGYQVRQRIIRIAMYLIQKLMKFC